MPMSENTEWWFILQFKIRFSSNSIHNFPRIFKRFSMNFAVCELARKEVWIYVWVQLSVNSLLSIPVSKFGSHNSLDAWITKWFIRQYLNKGRYIYLGCFETSTQISKLNSLQIRNYHAWLCPCFPFGLLNLRPGSVPANLYWGLGWVQQLSYPDYPLVLSRPYKQFYLTITTPGKVCLQKIQYR